MIYFGLSHIIDSSTRVDQRHILGGHNVNQDVIEYNFTEGIKRVRASLPLFENILFIDGTSDFGDIVAIHIEKSGRTSDYQLTQPNGSTNTSKKHSMRLLDGEDKIVLLLDSTNHFVPNPPHIDDSDIFIGR